jgi:3D-(3,5/4)-trihydroxycyclohexane-1,2-dione acylhydrolase (decyclizing)
MDKIRLTMAQALIRFLANQYVVFDECEYQFVENIFAIFGHGNVLGIGEALEFNAHGIKTYRGNNEQGMAHAAIAYAKQKRRLSIIPCTSSIGPGALNMVTAAGVATTNRLPLLLLPGDTFSDRQPDPVLQQIEQPFDQSITVNDAFKPVSKYFDRISRPEILMSAALNAMRVLTDKAETGAVTLSLPQDVQCEAYEYPISFFKKRTWHIEREVPSKAAILRVCEAIKKAKRPFVIAGGGARYSDAGKQLRDFSNRHGIPCGVTQAGKSILSFSDKYNVGGIGTTGTFVSNKLAQEADLILALGTRLTDFTTASKWLYPAAQLIQVNVNTLDTVKMDAMPLKGDVRETLSLLSEGMNKYETDNAYQHEIQQLKKQWAQEVNTLYHPPPRKEMLSQTEVIGILNQHVEPDDTIISAAGSLPGCLHRLWQSKQEGDYHLEYGFSCMGYEVAAGLGVTLAKEKGEAFVLVGDGSFLMMHSELVTAVQEQQKMTVVLFDNAGFHCIHNLQTANGSRGFGTLLNYRDEKGEHNGAPMKIDFAKYAEALGVKSFTVQNKKALQDVLGQARMVNRPVLIEVKIDPKTMSKGYESWWRVDVASVTESSAVKSAEQKMRQVSDTLREY